MTEQQRTATVIGATGLVGTELLNQLSRDPTYSRVCALSRRDLGRAIPKVECCRFDFGKPENYAGAIVTDVLFSCLGTTLKAAGSKEAQWRVDYDYQLWAAKAAADAGVATYVLISSVGAHPDAALFYPRMKGQLEAEVRELRFAQIRILRPSFLDGERVERRPAERAALSVLRRVPSWALPPAARPVPVAKVARACRLAASDPTLGVRILEADDVRAVQEGSF